MQTDHAFLSTSQLKSSFNDIPFLRILSESPLILSKSPQLKISDIMRSGDELAIEIAGRESFIGLYECLHSEASQRGPTYKLLNQLKNQGFVPSFEEGEVFIERHKLRRGDLGPDGASPPFLQIHFDNFPSPIFVRGRSMYGIPLSAHATPELTILSGPCLFGTHGITLLNENQEIEEILNPYRQKSFGRIVEIQIVDALSIYELEFVQRIGKTISHIATHTNTKSISLHVPREEYYLYLLERKMHGEISEPVKDKYLNAINDRNEHLKSLLREVIGDKIEFIQPLLCIRDEIEALLYDQCQSEEKCIRILIEKLCDKSSTFKTLVSLAPPRHLHDISNLSYLSGYVDAAKCTENDQRAALIIQNAPEEATFSTLVERIKIQNHLPIRIAALFSHERIFLRDDSGKFSHPYFANFFSRDRDNISEYIF